MHRTRPVNDHASPGNTRYLIANDEIALTRTHSGTAAAVISDRHPYQLVTSTHFILTLLKHVDDTDTQLDPVTHTFTCLNTSLDRCNGIQQM